MDMSHRPWKVSFKSSKIYMVNFEPSPIPFSDLIEQSLTQNIPLQQTLQRVKVKRKIFGYRQERLRYRSIDTLIPGLIPKKNNKQNSFSQETYEKEIRCRTDMSPENESQIDQSLLLQPIQTLQQPQDISKEDTWCSDVLQENYNISVITYTRHGQPQWKLRKFKPKGFFQ